VPGQADAAVVSDDLVVVIIDTVDTVPAEDGFIELLPLLPLDAFVELLVGTILGMLPEEAALGMLLLTDAFVVVPAALGMLPDDAELGMLPLIEDDFDVLPEEAALGMLPDVAPLGMLPDVELLCMLPEEAALGMLPLAPDVLTVVLLAALGIILPPEVEEPLDTLETFVLPGEPDALEP